MDSKILKCLFNHRFYEQNRRRLDKSLFEDEIRELYEILAEAHEKYQHDITADELFALWKVNNPVAIRAKVAEIQNAITDIQKEEPYSVDVATDLIEKLWQRQFGQRIANYGIALAEGKLSALADLTRLLEQNKDGLLPDDFPPPTTSDLLALLAMDDRESGFRFNIKSLASKVPSINRREFAVVFARPETGKTGFGISLACAPNGFCGQGYKVLYACNEEASYKTMIRAHGAWSGMTKDEMIANPQNAIKAFDEIRDNLVIEECQGWSFNQLEAFIDYIKPDVTIVDQLDKIKMPDSGDDPNHMKLRELYTRTRELAKTHNTAIIAMSQASADAVNKTVLDPSMMEGSKTGKFAEADLIIGIGKYPDDEGGKPEPIRFLTIGKNKLTGWHGTLACMLNAPLNRYTD